MVRHQRDAGPHTPRNIMKRLFITGLVSLLVGLVLGLVLGRKLPPSREQVANYIANLSMGEFKDFAQRMNAQFGFQAFSQHFLPGGAASPSVPAEQNH